MSKKIEVKRYRAVTMREALTVVKRELGDDALVLETRNVTEGGLFGLRKRDLVEVAVAASPTAAPARIGRTGRLDLTDGDAVLPHRAAQESVESADETSTRRSTSTLAALALRTYAATAAEPAAASPARNPFSSARGVELAETAPRVVHRPGTPALERARTPEPVADAAAASEIERLRTEMREMKFSLAALSTRAANVDEARTALREDPELFDSPVYEIYLELAASGLPQPLARRAALSARGSSVNRSTLDLAREALLATLPSMVSFAEDPVSIAPGTPGAPSAIALLGPTGVGKTTTIAKLAARIALRERRRVELVTLDTFRIAAVEQLRTYAEIIGAGCHVARTTLELDAVVSRFTGEAVVLVDTAGRNPNDLADQIELADYLKSREDMLKCLVLQATTHPSDAWVAARKFALYAPDWLVMTKLDETTRPGAAIGVAADAGLPLVYLTSGQRVPEDIEPATAATLARHAVRSAASAAA